MTIDKSLDLINTKVDLEKEQTHHLLLSKGCYSGLLTGRIDELKKWRNNIFKIWKGSWISIPAHKNIKKPKKLYANSWQK